MPRLQLNLEDTDDVAFVWWLLRELKPRHVHVAPPCTFWGQLGRLTARRSEEEWTRLRCQALHHLELAVRVMRWQHSQGLTGSFEQPPACASWRLLFVVSLLKIPGWNRFTWPSCAYGHRDPGSNRLFLKRQGFASNLDLSRMCRPCMCPRKSHQVVSGVVQGGPHQGARRSTASGAYPIAMCHAMVDIIAERWA